MEEEKKEEKILGVEQVNEVTGIVQGIIGKIGSLIGGIFGKSGEEKEK